MPVKTLNDRRKKAKQGQRRSFIENATGILKAIGITLPGASKSQIDKARKKIDEATKRKK